MASSEAMTSSTRSFAYSYRLVKKCFLKICETSKCHNFLNFQPIFFRFSLFCSENFTLSSEIKLEQLWTSPLRRRFPRHLCRLGERTIILETYQENIGKIWIIQSTSMILQSSIFTNFLHSALPGGQSATIM